ncbi:hypothetical protein [Bifidobacterium crudilactis]|uniref:hypothetical protein n=1 Tax=Bifidobacterium crudilactis TaxID=327277 RepID=UPI0026470F10|nr:hypothetical protein [Bifidobacterium crudilactis]MDN5971840.1 hypothetical protein [Bifidobacterium crudilactis]MDN6001140.1 hypothetical protein [Bifidobacterium crudilactis]MDN6466684.1 hypothetical protein [Bifidobacterium crudilactis]MDN6558101.1 hypothetical protein [Bifidobacterium crudilactis]MDN6773455.1 hypothetical protein [Bifidobacterium crudilactis]
MRIRSIKPEFWRSDDVDALSVFERLLFIGLWSYVDDNGVGVYSVKDIVSDLFAGDLVRDSNETLIRVKTGLQELSDKGLILIYREDGKDYLFVTNWEKHQRVPNPNKPRYPRPSNDSETPIALFNESLIRPHETLSTGTGEQRNRGTVLKPPVVPLEGDATAEDDSSLKPPKRRTSKTLIPDGWHPSEHHIKVAAEKHIDLATEAEKFRAYSESNAKRYANWDQAFNNWLLNCSNFNRSQHGYVNKSQQRYEQNMQRIRNAEIAERSKQPQLTGGADNAFGF